MAYADDLLRYARQTAEQYPNEAHQPSLRRALSSAYYSLFHLLIADAIANCTDPRFRATLSRMFEHGPMKNTCETTVERVKNLFQPNPPSEPERTIQFHLHNVADTFSQAQQNRNDADYNLLREWQPDQVSLLIEGVEDAFKSWYIIREDEAAQDFLISMLPTREKKQTDKGSSQKRKPRPTLADPQNP
jgi:hypothetical protein